MDFPPLEMDCGRCCGKGKMDRGDMMYDRYNDKCSSCDGTGKIATEFGEAVIEFVSKHLKIKLKIGG